MLRTRPIHYTSNMEAWARLLTKLGLKAEHDGGDWRLFTSGNGNVGLHFAEAGSEMDGCTTLGFEIRDREIFVQRTLEDGTRAELIEQGHGPGARVTAPNGFSFKLDPVTDLSMPDPEAKLAVMQLWYSQEASVQQKVLADIGAKLVVSSKTPEPSNKVTWAVYSAKNGGLTAVHLGQQDAVELSFEYNGDVTELAQQLALDGIHGHVVDESYGRTLLLGSPDNAEVKLWINQKQSDFHGYATHG